MANILSVENLTHHWGDIRLFNDLNFGLEEGEKAALIARNGSGKTTLLNVLAGFQAPDGGSVTVRNGIKLGYLTQDPVFAAGQSVMEAIFNTDNDLMTLVKNYEAAVESGNQKAIGELVGRMDTLNAWDYESRVKQILSQLKITNLSQKVDHLSGGQVKRVALAAVLVNEPDFLILDEPTNHLDLEMVDWLEEYLGRNRATLLMVTHDRFFLDRVCNVIFELDDESLYKYQGNYRYFLEKRDERQNQRAQEIERARNLLRKEQDWMNRMPQARATKAKYRIDAFYELKEVASQKSREQNMSLDIQTSRLGSKVLNLDAVNKQFDGRTFIQSFSHKFVRGEKIGIIGKNGAGKSTLLNILTGALEPDSGSVDLGETVVFGYYRQEGIQPDENKKVIDVISEIADVIYTGSGKSLDAAQFLRYFMFPNEMHHVLVSKLSGGEKKRLYLMTVLIRNPNFLILDEPTNDLDIFTLGILEEYLLQFGGCVLIVSHDRFFLDNVVDQLFVFEGEGVIRQFPGNYSQYHSEIAKKRQESAKERQVKAAASPVKEKVTADKPRKMTFKEKQEFQQLEADIARLESEKSVLEENLSSGSLDAEKLLSASNRLGELLAELDMLENRWIELSEL
ncbi:ABC-F family ATP-binding cassette domain-containing protein [Alkaliflexus imshenetskii]|uniref:ABC-F family ATP-binding cassette domain-containing protein n=1 Tax=Alkaliflexus imshenetskii TaxID=286730 RepID=UPI000478A3D8|nr:ABC-F family ATP-binding cassette domain-containing protein [Alkaliflexus imshenetskii]